MEYISLASVAEWVKNNPINFIGSAVTPWHAHGIDCAIRYLQDQGIDVKGLILIKPAIKQQEICHLLSEKNFTTNCCQVFKIAAVFDTRPLSVLKSMYHLYKSLSWYNRQYDEHRKRIIFIASPWHLDVDVFIQLHKTLNKSYGYRLILVEEGLSSYFPKIDTKRHLWNTLKTNKHGFYLLRAFIIAATRLTLRKRFEKKTSWTNLNLLVKHNNVLEANPLAIQYYSKILPTYVLENREQLPTENLNGCVIICTMAYLHTEIQDSEDVRILSLIVQKIKDEGFSVYLKPHPRDTEHHIRYASVGCKILSCNCSVEAIFVKYPQIKSVVSFSSTALVTATLLFGIQGVSILNLLDKTKFGTYIQEEMESFISCFSDIVKIPNSLDEFSQIYLASRQH